MEEWNDEDDRTEMMANSLAIRVPKPVADGAGLPEKDAVEIEVRRGRSSYVRICGEFIDWKTC